MRMRFNEYIELSYLVEGINVDEYSKVVSIDNSHDKGVITNPTGLLKYSINNIPVY